MNQCKHPRVQIVSRDQDTEYVECLECGEVFESSEFKDMAIEERAQSEEAYVPPHDRNAPMVHCAGEVCSAHDGGNRRDRLEVVFGTSPLLGSGRKLLSARRPECP
jgi:hypothetical protein